MSKSIYEEAIEILLNMGTEFISVPCNPIGEENSDMIHLRNVTVTYEPNMYEVVKALKQAQKQEKLLGLYKQAYDKSNAEVLKMFTYEQDEKTTLNNIIGHLDDSKTVVKIKELLK